MEGNDKCNGVLATLALVAAICWFLYRGARATCPPTTPCRPT
ncbi:hypothetical protein [Nannocystis sp. SCPEA4]|nr:hypothetical protein [Nannocystis sp. SCPEA4]MCY1055760.1 hypothetical protein [Nannocystis sp. SCPEA4]